ncbi:MAG: site-2 protease family protein [Oscillospiraceae bacterium]|jgi:Zn-dependent protease|nr:site-2 protease family protein [Oscillospiraceae bacterium]
MDLVRYRPIFQLFDWFAGNTTAANVLISFFAAGVMIFMIFPVREYACGMMAKCLGDDTAERQGRLTLNPFAHIDPLGSLMLLLFPLGWSKPMPINPGRCNKVSGKTAMLLITLAGPAALIIVAYIFMIIFKLLLINMANEAMAYSVIAVSLIVQICAFIAVLNLLPIPPLAGSRILFFFLKPRQMYKIMEHQRIITMVFFVLLFIPNSPLMWLIQQLAFYLLSALNFLSGFIR